MKAILLAVSFFLLGKLSFAQFGNDVLISSSYTNVNQLSNYDLTGDGLPELIHFSQQGLMYHVNFNGSFGMPQTLVNGWINDPWKISIVDWDNDSDLDILHLTTSGMKWQRNNGTGNFTQLSQINTPGMVGIQQFLADDINQDGFNDLMLYDGTNLTWYKNNGSQQFSAFNTIAFPGLVAFTSNDFDADGDNDLICNSNGWCISFQNSDNLQWQALDTLLLTPGYAHRYQDITNDGIPELSYYFPDSSEIRCYIGETTGFHSNSFLHTIDVDAMQVASAFKVTDVNNDGVNDYCYYSMNGEIQTLLLNTSVSVTGSFAFLTDAVTINYFSVADIENNGLPEFIIPSTQTIDIYENNGSGVITYRERAQDFNYWLNKVIATDLNDDGNPDLITGNGYELFAYLNQGNGQFTTKESLGNYSNTVLFEHTVTDLDGDGLKDVVCSSELVSIYSGIVWFRNTGNGQFNLEPALFSLGASNEIHSVTSDFDLDNDPDILFLLEYGQHPAMLENTGNAQFDPVYFVTGVEPPTNFPRELLVTDMNADSYPDVVYYNTLSGEIGWWKNNGDLTFNSFIITSGIPLLNRVAVTDYDNNGYPDIAVLENNSTRLSVFHMGNNQTINGQTVIADLEPLGQNIPYFLFCDVNQDAAEDVLVVRSVNNQVVRFMNNGDGTFSSLMSFENGSVAHKNFLHLSDVTGDQKPDLIAFEDDSKSLMYYPGEAILSANEIVDKEAHLQLFPNPATDVFNLKLPATVSGKLEVELTTTIGTKILSTTIGSNYPVVSIPKSAINGVYIVTVKDVNSNTTYSSKLLLDK